MMRRIHWRRYKVYQAVSGIEIEPATLRSASFRCRVGYGKARRQCTTWQAVVPSATRIVTLQFNYMYVCVHGLSRVFVYIFIKPNSQSGVSPKLRFPVRASPRTKRNAGYMHPRRHNRGRMSMAVECA